MAKFGYYFESYNKRNSLCSVCGITYHEKGYRKLWHAASWFRGEDDYLGIYCKDCAKDFETEHEGEMK